MPVDRISVEMRDKLYDEVWSEAMSKIAPRYGMSDVALRKRCIKWGIPLPDREYRGRMAAGQKPARQKLPELDDEMKRYVYGYALSLIDVTKLPEETLYSDQPLLPFSEKTKTLMKNACETARVPDSDGCMGPEMKKHFDALPPEKQDENRRLFRIAGVLISCIYEFEGYGHYSGNNAKNSIYLCLAGIHWDVKLQNYVGGNSGMQGLTFTEGFSPRGKESEKVVFTYTDGPDLKLEDMFGDILFRIFTETGKLILRDELNNRKEVCRKAEAAYWKKLEPFIDAENEKVNRALADAEAYRKAETIRNFAAAYYDKYNMEFASFPDKANYHQWLLQRADWIDPLVKNDYDSLLKTDS